VLKLLLFRAAKWLANARKWKLAADDLLYKVGYTSVPLWKPWRDF